MVIACGADDPVPPALAEPPATAPTASPAEADVASLRATMAAGAVRLIDVRTPAEYAEAHVPGAVNIPLSELDARLGELESDRDTDLYLICASGRRSGRAAATLAGAGFSRPINVTGGTNAWKAAGLPTESGTSPNGDTEVE